MGVDGKCVTKENPKSNLDLDLGFVNILFLEPYDANTKSFNRWQAVRNIGFCQLELYTY